MNQGSFSGGSYSKDHGIEASYIRVLICMETTIICVGWASV